MEFELTAEQILKGQVWVILVSSYAGGFLTALSPCVYPLIPVTLGLLGVGKPKRRREIVFFGLLFVLGLAVVYSTLGFLAATSGHLLGGITQTKEVVFFVAIIFFVMGIGMLGFFEISLPSSLTGWLARQDPSGYQGAFLLGGTSGILAAPCSGPVVIGILAYVAQQSNPLLGVLLLFTFSLGMGTPFFFLTIFSRYLTRLPKGGEWMEGIKHLAGFAMIGAAILFLRPFFSGAAFLGFSLALLVYIALYARRYFSKFAQFARLGALWGMIVLLILQRGLVASYFVPDISGIDWIPSESKGLTVARSSDKPMVLDFWASWCASCRQLDRETFSDPRVEQEIIRNFVAVKIDASDFSNPDVQKLVKKYGVLGLPTIVFTDSQGRVMQRFSINGFVSAQEFVQKLQTITGLPRESD